MANYKRVSGMIFQVPLWVDPLGGGQPGESGGALKTRAALSSASYGAAGEKALQDMVNGYPLVI